MTIDVCLSPDLLSHYDLKGKLVVVTDVLRATSCMVTGIAHGVGSITPFASLSECTSMKAQGYVTAGERGGEKVDGFDLGNSPFSYMAPELKGAKIAATTTNGTRAIVASSDADEIIIGAFLNLSSIAAYVQANAKETIVVCSGWKGRPSLEDTLFAGAVASKVDFLPADDSVSMATHLFTGISDLAKSIQSSAHAQRLAEFDVAEDLRFCARIDAYDVVPRVLDGVIRL